MTFIFEILIVTEIDNDWWYIYSIEWIQKKTTTNGTRKSRSQTKYIRTRNVFFSRLCSISNDSNLIKMHLLIAMILYKHINYHFCISHALFCFFSRQGSQSSCRNRFQKSIHITFHLSLMFLLSCDICEDVKLYLCAYIYISNDLYFYIESLIYNHLNESIWRLGGLWV